MYVKSDVILKLSVFIYFQIKNINDERVEVTLMNTFDATEATPVSPYDSDFVPFQIIANSIHDVFNNAILTPGVMVRIFPVLASMYIFFFTFPPTGCSLSDQHILSPVNPT